MAENNPKITRTIYVRTKEQLAQKVQSLVGHGGMKQVMEQINKAGLEKGVAIKVIKGPPIKKTVESGLATAQKPSGSVPQKRTHNVLGLRKGMLKKYKGIQEPHLKKTGELNLATAQKSSRNVPQKSTHALSHNSANDFDYNLFLNAKDLANESFEMFMATLLKWGASVSAKNVGDLQGYLYHLSLICEMAAMSIYDIKTHMDYDKAVRLQAKQSGWQAFKDDNTCLRTIYYMVQGIKQEVDLADLKHEFDLDKFEHGSDQDTTEKEETPKRVLEDVSPDLSESVEEDNDLEPHLDLPQSDNVSGSINNEIPPDLLQKTKPIDIVGNQESKESLPEGSSKPGGIILGTTDRESNEPLPVKTVQKNIDKEINTFGNTKSFNEEVENIELSIKEDPKKENVRYPCLYCNQSYGRKQRTIKHIKKVHPANLDDYLLKTPKKKKAKKPPPQKFPCEQCDRIFTKLTLLEKHISTKHFLEGQTFPCNHCHKTFTHPSKVRVHTTRVHGSVTDCLIKQHKCSLCDMTFKWSTTLKCHMVKVHKQGGYVCNFCGLTCSSTESLKLHEMRHSDHKRFFCLTCGKGFLRKDALQLHTKTHTGEKDYMCSTCGKKFIAESNFKRHLLIHTGEKLYKCELCDKRFTRLDFLKEHSILKHMDVKPHSCTECGKGFIHLYKLNKHLETHSPNKPFICSELQCGRSFSHEYRLKAHHITVHSDISKPKLKSLAPGSSKKLEVDSIGKNLNCPYCSKTNRSKHSLITHMRIHTGEKPFSCSDCGKAFAAECALRAHIFIHSGVKPYKCTDCGFKFSTAANFKRHMLVHSDERPLVCSICQKTFRNPSVFSVHMKRHRGEKDHECKECGKSFVEKGTLDKHKMTHTGERPFVCDVCKKGFICKSQLNLHMKRHQSGD